MKKTFLLLSISAFSIANAQSITVNDTLRTGDKIYYYEGDIAASNLDATIGASASWDYSALTSGNTAVKDSVIISANADYSNAFHQEQFDGGINVFFTNTPTEMTSYGFVFDFNGQNATINYNVDPMQAMVFPMAFGTTDYTDAISGNLVTVAGAIPVDIAVAGTATIKADGNGTLTLGTTTFTDVVRIKTIEVLDGNVPPIPLVGFAGGPVNITRTSYAYYSLSDSRLPVFLHGKLNAIVPTQPDIEQINVWSSVDLSASTTNGIETDEVSTLSIFPNPATDNLSIESINATSIHILNAVGQVVYSNSNPISIETVDVSTFETGIYIVEVKNNETITTKKLIIE